MKEERENEEHRKMRVLHVIMADPKVTNERIEKITGMEKGQISKYIKRLKESGRIEHDGEKWVVKTLPDVHKGTEG